ncbi:MAG: class I SAM-dependent methyltransferase [candidate division KSB1 bacterium]|nr:class I SAM-dependent methyltransferase [candidate division KSB1 bacterium]
MHHTPIAAGGSSFELINSARLFGEIHLKMGMRFLDVACGYGYYSIAVSQYVGETGNVCAVDLWQDGIVHLSNHLKANSIHNIHSVLADARKMIPLKNSSVDLCLLATVLHDFMHEKTEEGVLKEIHRVLKAGGKFAIVEFKKIASKPGPPIEIRITPEQVNNVVIPYGFEFLKTVEIGQFHYLSLFEKMEA